MNPIHTSIPAVNGCPTPHIDRALLEEEILPQVFKPARYLGLEQGAFRKSFEKAAVTMAVAFPDLYEIGFSNYGLKLLYSLVNQQQEYMCDRVYAPAPDFKEKLAEYQMPLYAVETMRPLTDFDVLAFSLQYELNYTTILGLLDAAMIPFRSSDRTDDHWPLLIAGGPGSANPMPLSPFFDVFIIGDGEEVLLEMLDVIKQAKKDRARKPELLQRLSKLDGLYIPGITEKAYKRIVDIAENPVELAPLIPLIGAVHDRVTVEARRGCDRMCRFCQPCFINLPVREQSIENIKKSALREIEKTGYEECSLLSLSIADYSYFKPLILEVAEALEEENVSLSLPSQRADRFSLEVAEAVQSVRKSTLTFAPEAGTPRLRDVINKNLTDAEIMNAVTTAYKSGWNKVKLYFIIGLPTETHDDLDGIVDIVQRMQNLCAEIKREAGKSMKNWLEVNVTLSNFVPKPHTPFQWFPQDTMEQLHHKIGYLKDKFRAIKGVKVNYTDPEISKLEAVISRAGVELADVIEDAYRNGAYLDAWDDIRNFDRWFEALQKHGIHHEAYTRDRCTNPDEPLPWDPIDVGLTRKWLKEEYERATAATSTTPCFEECSVCGVCGSYSTWPKFIETPRSDAAKAKQKVRNTAELSETDIPQLKKKPVCKVRLKLEKKDKLRFISHLDWLRMLYRAVSRSNIPVAYSQGFNPKPKISFGPALPLFTESYCEFVDIELTEEVRNIKDRMNPYLPIEGQILDEALLPWPGKSIDQLIRTVTYTASVALDGEHPENRDGDVNSSARTTCADGLNQGKLTERIALLKSQDRLPIEVDAPKSDRKRNRNQADFEQSKQVLDLAPYIEDLSVVTLPANGAEHAKEAIRFTIRRLPVRNENGTQPDNGPGNGNDAGAAQGISQENNTGQENQQGKMIKPSWVLGLINDKAKWSVVRTDIQLDSAQQPTLAVN